MVTPEYKLQYKYDPLGRRLEKSVDGSPIHYVYDNEDIVAMLDSDGKVQQTFTHGPGIDEPLIMTKADGANYYYHADGLGSIVALTGDNAQLAETYTYKAYGQPKLKNAKGEELKASVVGNPYLFTARELDAEAGLYYYRARYYDWQRGAFTQEDPIGVTAGWNLYSYVGNDPSGALDPYGEFIISIKILPKEYGSVTLVWQNLLLPPSIYTSGTGGDNGTEIKSGVYRYKYGKHKIESPNGYPALNLYTRDNDRKLPATREDNPSRETAVGINVHRGNLPGSKKGIGSSGCHVIPGSAYERFMRNFSQGDEGAYVYIRFY